MTEAETLRSRLSRKPIVVAPGVYDPFTALIAARAGFDGALCLRRGDRLHQARPPRHRSRHHDRGRRTRWR